MGTTVRPHGSIASTASTASTAYTVEDADEVVHGCLEEAVEEVGHFYTRHHLCKPLAM